MCAPALRGLPDGVLPTYFPSNVISAPEGIELKLHIMLPGRSFCAERLGGGGAAIGAASDAFCPGATATGCGAGTGRGGAPDVALGCEFAVAPDSGPVPSPANLYNRVVSLPFEACIQTVSPFFPFRASYVSPTDNGPHFDHRESTEHEIVKECPSPSCTCMMFSPVGFLLSLQ